MAIAQMIVISLITGMVAAGCVWFGCNLLENLQVLRRLAAQKKASEREAAQADESKENAE